MFRHIGRFLEVGIKIGSSALHLKDDAYAPNFRQILGNLKGPLVKMAQFLSTIPDAIPENYAKELRMLQSKAPPMSENKVIRCLESELGKNWKDFFEDFNLTSFAAASLGQVHKATLKDGREVACKIQYPHMRTYVESDLSYISLFFSLYKRFYGAIDADLVLKEMRERLFEELDYRHEAAMMKRLKLYGSIPNVISELSKNCILTMDLMKGHDFLAYSMQKSQDWRNEIAKKLFSMWYTPFYKEGLLHADPHPGNYLVTEDQEIQWLDFGCVRQFPKSFVEGVVKLYNALSNNNRDAKMEAYYLWGFENLNRETEEAVTLWAKLLFDPVLDDRIRPIQPSFSGKTGWQVAQNVHRLLRQSGGLRPPKTFVFMDRVAVGLGGVFMHLKAEINWYQLYQEIQEKISK